MPYPASETATALSFKLHANNLAGIQVPLNVKVVPYPGVRVPLNVKVVP